MATKKAKQDIVAPELPSSVTLHRPHGFIAEDGTPHYWPEGFIETCPAKIQTLIERKAPLKEPINAD